jgi:hypothetical protein
VMSRRRRREQYDEYDDQGQPERPVRKKSGNEGLYIALGVAGLIGLIIVLIIAGSSSTEQDTGAALGTLQTFLRACIEDNEKEGMKMIVARELLRDQNTNDTKVWSSLSPERREALTRQAFRWVRGRVIQDLQLMNMEQVDNILRASTPVTFGGEPRIDFQWVYAGEKWNASLVLAGEVWRVQRFDKRGG